ncbi:kelch-like protein 38 isoform X1 [Latimeria chalumnae]|uniref:Kelch like family member 38 n=1 Tax=Latimeria chalumnae TaxID=7897 RepID=H3ACG4_LATCH|nr:PREDICTED: kelch-like protein 38 isoform X1 [Latimeria chalumnae]XP_014346795.1 PREDICTED: kelch-like protein 38 isoform X1 [Latimeria chalumnae]XP_014346796.1 PREDICTED: kelch-like protein 38 isoform X1 [Latimeria chalumnae]|eukprot:XP_006000864.1 PREDICTED: kelch-like protein 38 isoform X1 [Latimeria chalumnae]
MDKEPLEGIQFKDQDISSCLLQQLNNLRQDRILTDVILCTSDKEFPCHRNVLVASSPYFRAMFCNNFRESCQPKINMMGLYSDILDQIVNYVYTGEIIIKLENVLPLMEAASMLQYPNIFEACSTFLQNQLTPDNCLGMLRLSEILNCENLNQKAKTMALLCFPDVAISEDLKELSLNELADYLGDDGLCGEEEQVFETMMVWIRHNIKERQGLIHDLFQKVRLQYVHPTYLFHFIGNDPLIQSSPACRNILESARRLMLSLSIDSAPDIKPLGYVPRRYTCQEFLVIIGGRKNSQQTTREALLFNEQTRQWLALAKLPVRLYKASSVCLHSNVYVLGGMVMNCKNSTVSSNVYTFSLKMNQWRIAEPMLGPRYSHNSIAYKNCIFSLGGVGPKQQILNTVERYNSIFNIWEAMAPLPVAVLHPAIAAKDQRIYVFGGEDIMQNPVRLIQVYNVSRNMWFRMETRMVKNVCAPAVIIGDRIFIVGGYTKRMIHYDTKANKFIKCADMKERRMHHGAAVINNKLYITGGRYLTAGNIIEDSDSFDCYDPETDKWTSNGKLPHKLFDHGCVTLLCATYKVNSA